jgi:hypothetical protein
MKNRSPIKIVILNFLTLGFYEIVWLSETRQEMVAKYGVEIPPAKTIGVVYWFQWLAVLLALVSLGLAFNQWNTVAAKPPILQPSQNCFLQYAETNGPGAKPASTLSSICKSTVDNYFAASDERSNEEMKGFYFAGAFFGLVIAGLLSVFVTVRWLKQYALGVEIVTKGQVSKGKALQYLSSTPPYFHIPKIQSAFNKTQPPVTSTIETYQAE